jgi:hypothetical protein
LNSRLRRQRRAGFNGVEVFALDVLNQADLEQAFVLNLVNDRGDFVEAGHLGRAPAAFARR